MSSNVLRKAAIAGAIALPLGAFVLPAYATVATEGDYIPKHAVPIADSNVVHHGPFDVSAARKIVLQAGYRDVRFRGDRGETYLFTAKRNGRKTLLRVDREEGTLLRG